MEIYDNNHGYVGKKIAEFDNENGYKYYVLDNTGFFPGIIAFSAKKTTLLSAEEVQDRFNREYASEKEYYDRMISYLGQIYYRYSAGHTLGAKLHEFVCKGVTIGVFDPYPYLDGDLYPGNLWQDDMQRVEPADKEKILDERKRTLERVLTKYEYYGIDVSKEKQS